MRHMPRQKCHICYHDAPEWQSNAAELLMSSAYQKYHGSAGLSRPAACPCVLKFWSTLACILLVLWQCSQISKVPCSQEQSASHGSVQYPGSVHGGSVHGHGSVQHFCAGLGGPRCGLWVVNIVAAKQQARLRQISKTVSSDFHPAC